MARALVGEPSLLLCDEPTGALDPPNRDVVLDLLQRVAARGTAVVVVTHDPHVAQRCNRSLHLTQGSLDETGLAETGGAATATAQITGEDGAPC